MAAAATLVLTSLAATANPAAAAAASRPIVQAPALPGAQPIGNADRVYTADQTSNTVTVIQPSTRRVLGTLALGDERLGQTFGPQYLATSTCTAWASPATASTSTSSA